MHIAVGGYVNVNQGVLLINLRTPRITNTQIAHALLSSTRRVILRFFYEGRKITLLSICQIRKGATRAAFFTTT